MKARLLHHGTLMPIRGFGRSLGTGKSLSFDYPNDHGAPELADRVRMFIYAFMR